ncbi:hypothetical protein B835_2681 [Enterococcus mundtii 3F]|uniref:hypothetical protein n=1 Tax=Enterococcus mundtii TaxID=53346 RepID=UPI002302EFC9|nr:hypothetical protein [Enterococcus mundtii]MDA9462723.1 hypothetical protein [Enterococcus mundtii 3F]
MIKVCFKASFFKGVEDLHGWINGSLADKLQSVHLTQESLGGIKYSMDQGNYDG